MNAACVRYNFGCAQHDTDDWLGPDTDCRGSAKAAVMHWPPATKQAFSPVGGDVLHGSWLTGGVGRGNPCRQAFEDWLGPGKGRSSWDPIAVLIAVRGAGGVHCKEVNSGGHNVVNEAGEETWVPGPPGSSNQSQIQCENPPSLFLSVSLPAPLSVPLSVPLKPLKGMNHSLFFHCTPPLFLPMHCLFWTVNPSLSHALLHSLLHSLSTPLQCSLCACNVDASSRACLHVRAPITT